MKSRNGAKFLNSFLVRQSLVEVAEGTKHGFRLQILWKHLFIGQNSIVSVFVPLNAVCLLPRLL